MPGKRKKNKGNSYAERGEEFAEAVIKSTEGNHPAQNAPATPHNR
ncbi:MULTISPECIES: hypothetical protein [Cohnella]|uniref:Uncharacterized protein n=1 Tax=Cohnella rhizosphaerae TaxID=1457232 RepID=A0A9X4KYJ8_9BACL|nr:MULTISPECIES: hypothetical protein [Cohnella]MDG0813739.1 hypothetical protein [Cohnella rhizosphaerae]